MPRNINRAIFIFFAFAFLVSVGTIIGLMFTTLTLADSELTTTTTSYATTSTTTTTPLSTSTTAPSLEDMLCDGFICDIGARRPDLFEHYEGCEAACAEKDSCHYFTVMLFR